jgi:hypothetical protein
VTPDVKYDFSNAHHLVYPTAKRSRESWNHFPHCFRLPAVEKMGSVLLFA